MPDRLGMAEAERLRKLTLPAFCVPALNLSNDRDSVSARLEVEKFLRSFRVPAAYLGSAFLQFFAISLFRRIKNLRKINPPGEFDSHPGHQSFQRFTSSFRFVLFAGLEFTLPLSVPYRRFEKEWQSTGSR
jgi:hypothetical protein